MITTHLSDSPYTDETDDFLEIEIEGLSTLAEQDDGTVILVEFYEGRWWLRVWADINDEDPTHIIDLSGAELEHRNDP